MIHLEFINLIISKSILDAKYSGGLAQYRIDMPKNSLTEDEHLIRFGAMNWNVIENVTELIINKGISFSDGRSDDFTVVEPLHGLTWDVEWLDIMQNGCFYNPTQINEN